MIFIPNYNIEIIKMNLHGQKGILIDEQIDRYVYICKY